MSDFIASLVKENDPEAAKQKAELLSGPLPVNINNLYFSYPGRDLAITGLNMQLVPGARCILIGANGAGKSTLLRLLSGRHLVKPDDALKVFDRYPFHDTKLNLERAYLDMDWGMRSVAFAGYGCPLQADIAVKDMMKTLQDQFPERRDLLIKLLRIDPEWKMHQVSDGQRRRVQIFIGLLRPFKILLLDEVTISLDVVVRQDLLRYLKHESETRGCTIIYATHIYDGLDGWPTHVHYLKNKGRTGWQGKIEDLELYNEFIKKGETSPLLRVAETWLRKELDESGELEEANGMGAHIGEGNAKSTVAAGGFSSGRMASYDFIN